MPLAPLKLVTMTISISTSMYLNLNVIADYIPINDEILNVSYRKVKRGKFKGSLAGEDLPVNDSEKFKNQCTFDINIGAKIINTKLFNNGKIINVGCLDITHAKIAVDILMRHIWKLSGGMVIPLVQLHTHKNVKKFFKDDLRKKYSALIQLFVQKLGIDFDLTPFNPALSADDAYGLFTTLCKPSYEQNIMYIYTMIQILKNYYDEKNIHQHMNEAEFNDLFDLIREKCDMKDGVIRAVFPSYLNHDRLISAGIPEIVLINKSTNSGYFINRNNLEQLLQPESAIISCKFDKNRYPGVIIEYQTADKKNVKIIVFNTGKINITAARTEEQIKEAYDFINAFCQTHFEQLILKSEYHNKLKEYESNLPDQFNIGMVKDKHFYLLKKTSITANPRNLRILKLHGYLEKYNI